MSKLLVRTIAGLSLSAGLALSAAAQEKAAPSAEELAKKLANPIASMISVPFQTSVDVGIGPNYGSKMVLNIQPIIPIALTPKLNLITRWIVPIVSQLDVAGARTSQAGLGDPSNTFTPFDF